MSGLRTVAAACAAAALAFTAAGPAEARAAAAPTLRAGVGQADITPPLGYSLGGWQRADQRGRGVSTRLYSRALVLQRGRKKLALVAVSLWAVSAGMEEDIARSLADLGLDADHILISANHTHQGPAGFSNNPGLNAEAPSPTTITDPQVTARFVLAPAPADPPLYDLLVRQIAQSVRRADADRGPAVAGWGRTEILGLTRNRSLEAFLANFGIDEPYGKGRVEQAPGGYRSTIDPDMDVLRVDKLVRVGDRTVRRPIGAWSTFANHGTVVKGASELYSEDHFAAANRLFAAAIRRRARVPARQAVVNVFANGAEGDISSGLTRSGVMAAEDVGRTEAGKLMEAWRDAGRRLSRTPALGVRSTVSCFCGRGTATGPVARDGVQGLPFITGSEEGRGPLFDLTQTPFEGYRSPTSTPDQGNKIQVPLEGAFSPAAPISVVRVADRAIAALPVEANHRLGEDIEGTLLAATRSLGVRRAVVAGLTDEWVGYATTPKEYAWQAYEAGRAAWGPNEGTFLQERIGELGAALARGAAAPPRYAPYDPSFGVHPTGARFPDPAVTGTITAQPPATTVGRDATLAWTGAPGGYDRPVDAPFVRVQKRAGGGWRTVDSDLGLDMIWRADDAGAHTLAWHVPAGTPAGLYRFVVTAVRYRLDSQPFSVTAAPGR